jgi:hypothetical protein
MGSTALELEADGAPDDRGNAALDEGEGAEAAALALADGGGAAGPW